MTDRLAIPNRREVDDELPVERPWWQFSARFNVAIPQNVPVARMHEREREGVMMRWGLALQCAQGGVNFTTRGAVGSAALRSDQELRTPWLHGRRGIVPVAGFYLWQRAPAGHRQPYYVRLKNRPVFGIAALWERAETSEGEVIESCALIAVDASPLPAGMSNLTAQMPAILRREDYAHWLTANVSQAQELLHSCPQAPVVCHPVGPHVNHLEFDEPALIKPAANYR